MPQIICFTINFSY